MTFTYRQAALWSALTIICMAILALLVCGGWFTITGLSLALNVYLSWQCIGHDTMLASLGITVRKP